jgi:hypothetical protein
MVAFGVPRLNGRRCANFGSGFAGLGSFQLAIFEPKKLPIPPIVARTSGRDDAIGVAEVAAVGGTFVLSSRSFSRLFTSERTPSNARKKVEDPAAIADPIASFVGPS